jgi:hypothetical protein
MKIRDHILTHSGDFLPFLRTRVPVFHLSNVFFRDIHYAVIAFAAENRFRVGYTEAEGIAHRLIERLEKEKLLLPIDHRTWAVNREDLRKPGAKPAAPPAKPATPPVQPA